MTRGRKNYQQKAPKRRVYADAPRIVLPAKSGPPCTLCAGCEALMERICRDANIRSGK